MYRRITKLIQLLKWQHLSCILKLLMMDDWHSLKGKDINSIAFLCPGALGESARFPVCTNLPFKIVLCRFALFSSQTQITPKTTKKAGYFFFHKRNRAIFTSAWSRSSGMKNRHSFLCIMATWFVMVPVQFLLLEVTPFLLSFNQFPLGTEK